MGRLEGRARRSSFPSLDRLALPLDRPPLLRLPNPPPTAALAAADLSPGLLRRRRLLPGQCLCYCPVLVLSNALLQVQISLRRRGYIDPVRPLYSSSYPPLLTRPLSVAFAPCICFTWVRTPAALVYCALTILPLDYPNAIGLLSLPGTSPCFLRVSLVTDPSLV